MSAHHLPKRLRRIYAQGNPATIREEHLDIARRASRNLRRHRRRCRDCRPKMPCLVALQYADDLRRSSEMVDPEHRDGAEARELVSEWAPVLEVMAS